MSSTLQQLADLVQGQIHGDASLPIGNARPMTEAQTGDITFVESEKHARLLHDCRASAVIVPATLPTNGVPFIRVADPLQAFIAVVRHFRGDAAPPPPGIDPRAAIHPTAQIGADASIQAFAAIGAGAVIGARCRIYPHVVIGARCRLGDDVTLYPGTVLYEDTIVGHRVLIHANSVIGADGFGYRFQQGRHVKVPQLGHVELGDDVEIGACTTIDRATFGATRIGTGTKIDNLVQVGHNCQVGAHNLFVSQLGMAGSCSTGDYVVIAGQVGIADHIDIGAGAVIGAKAGVSKDVPPKAHMLGAPARPENETKRMLMNLEKLPEFRKDLKRIKKHLGLPDEE